MKTKIKISFAVVTFMLLFVSRTYGQGITCPFSVTNNLDCAVEVQWESFEQGCVHLCGAPNTQVINANSSANIASGPCCIAAGDVSVKISKFDPNSACTGPCTPSQNPPVSGGCTAQSYDSGSVPPNCDGPTPPCCGSTWQITWNGTGVVIDP